MRSDLQSDTSKSSNLRTYEELVRQVLGESPSDRGTESTYQQSLLALRGEFKRDSFLLEAFRLQSQTQRHIAWAKALPQVVKYVGRGLFWASIAASTLSSAEVRTAVAGLGNRDGTKLAPTSTPPTTDTGQASAPFIKSSLRT